MSRHVEVFLVSAAAAIILSVPAAAMITPPADSNVDEAAEGELVRLANEERAQAGLPKLETDERITQAARAHARLMAERGNLSHQFPGEVPLMQRLAQSDLRFSAAAENVSSSQSAADSHAGIMRSPPHRANLLNARYNAIGVGVVRRGSLIYVAQNFAHKLPERTAAEAEGIIADTFRRARRGLKQRDVRHAADDELRAAACRMADADKPYAGAAPEGEVRRRRAVVAYTATSPEELPEAMEKLAQNGDVRRYSLGACFARSTSYPAGTFWVLAIFEF